MPVRLRVDRLVNPAPFPLKVPLNTFAGLVAVTTPAKTSVPLNTRLLLNSATLEDSTVTGSVPLMFVAGSGVLSCAAAAALSAWMA